MCEGGPIPSNWVSMPHTLHSALGSGLKINYENDRSPNLSGLQEFIAAYRSVLPYEAAATNPAARLTIDLAPGDEYLVPLTQYATSNWLTTTHPVLDYANAMVPFEQTSASTLEEGWEEHVRGKSPVPPSVGAIQFPSSTDKPHL